MQQPVLLPLFSKREITRDLRAPYKESYFISEALIYKVEENFSGIPLLVALCF